MKIIKAIQYLIIFLIAVLALLLIFSTFPIPGSYLLKVVQSGSMEPAIKVGSVVLIQPQGGYQVGDVVTFRSTNQKDQLTTHRIVKQQEGTSGTVSYITKGDANSAPDNKEILTRNIVGRVLFTLPYLGYAVNFVKQPLGFFLLIVLPATLVIYDEIRKIKNEVILLRQKKALIILVFLSSGLIFLNYTQAFFADTEVSTGNVLQAADSFGPSAPLYLSNSYICPDGALIKEEQFGTVAFDFGLEDIFFKVVLTNATPNFTYDIWVNQNPGACPLSSPSFPNGITTDTSGNSEKTFNIPKVTGATKFWISVSKPSNVLRSTAVEE